MSRGLEVISNKASLPGRTPLTSSCSEVVINSSPNLNALAHLVLGLADAFDHIIGNTHFVLLLVFENLVHWAG
jgi:hypothetical protein